MTRTHDYLAVERALTQPERSEILRRWYEINPHHRGAQVADVLDFLDSSDSHLEVTEPLWEAHPEWHTDRGRHVFSLAALAVVYAYGETERGTCLRCRGAGRTPGNAFFPGQDPCGRCDGSGEADVPTARWELVEGLLDRVRLPGDVLRLAGAGSRPDPDEVDADLDRLPVHAFEVGEAGALAGTSLCGRLALGDSDASVDPVAYELAELDARCAWCDARVSEARAAAVVVTGP